MKFGNLVEICLWPHLAVKGLKQVLAQEFVYAFPRTSDSRLLEVAVLRTETIWDINEFTQQDGRMEGTANARVRQM